MGDIADAIIGGFYCEICGEIIDNDEPGYPRNCQNCASKDMVIDSSLVEKILTDNGYVITIKRPIQDGIQLRLSTGSIVNLFKTGRVNIQGKPDEKLKALFK